MFFTDVLIGPECTLCEALKSIDAAALRLVLVVDKERNLLGTVTDGDVRRALLSGFTLKDKVTAMMTTSPIVVDVTASKERIIELMKHTDIITTFVLEGQKFELRPLISNEELCSNVKGII